MSSPSKYRALADGIAALIAGGMLRPGERLPSVRETVAARGLSPSTVFEAYYLLESWGLVEARPRSGYFVRHHKAAPAPAPDAPLRRMRADDLAQQVLGSVREGADVPLGSAFPDPALFPLDTLARGLAASMRRLRASEIVGEMTPGNDELRRLLARRSLATGARVQPDEIVMTNGAMEALDLCLRAVTRPGDTVAVESPAFYGALQALERHGLRALEVPTDPRHGVRLDDLQRLLGEHDVKALWFMPTLQNPLGASMPVADRERLAALLRERRLPLIEDDVYGDLQFERRDPPVKAFDTDGWVMHCASFSKSLAPGYRVGWAAAGRFTDEVRRLKLASTVAVSVPSQRGVLHFLQHHSFDKHLRQLRGELARRRDEALRAVLRHFPGETRVARPDGGYFLWLEMPPDVDALRLHEMAAAHGIVTAPGPMFSRSGGFGHHLRLNYGHPRFDDLAPAIATLGRLAARAAHAAGSDGAPADRSSPNGGLAPVEPASI